MEISTQPYLIFIMGVLLLIAVFLFRKRLAVTLAFGFCMPMYLLLRCLMFALQTFSWLVNRQIEQGKYSIMIKVLTRTTYWLHVVYDSLVADFNSVVNILGEEDMAITIQKAGKPETYVPKSEDENDPQRAEFYFQKLRATRRAAIKDGVVGLKKGRVNRFRSNTVSLQLVLEGLTGWKNILNEEGLEQTFDAQNKAESFDLLPVQIQEELLAEYGSGQDEEVEEEDGAAEADADALAILEDDSE